MIILTDPIKPQPHHTEWEMRLRRCFPPGAQSEFGRNEVLGTNPRRGAAWFKTRRKK